MQSPEENWWIVRAGEYVLGTLRGHERDLFEKILAHDVDVQREVARWEQQLSVFDEHQPDVQPAEHVLPGILTRIRDDETQGTRTVQSPTATPPVAAELEASKVTELRPATPRQATARQSRLWPSIAGLATAASLVLGVLLFQQYRLNATVGFSADGVSVVSGDDSGELYYLIETDYKSEQIRVTALSPPTINPGQTYQLWQATADRSGVKPMTVLQTAAGESRIYDVSNLVDGSDLFGVSIEAAGTTATEAGPQGPVVAHGDHLLTRVAY